MPNDLRILNPTDWTATPLPSAAGGRARRGMGRPAAEDATLPQSLLLPGVRIDEAHEIAPTPARRGAPAAAIDVEVSTAPSEAALIAVRHPSGALTFHPPVLRTERGTRRGGGRARRGATSHRFRIELPASAAPARRGLVSAAAKFLVLKIAQPAIDAARALAGDLLAKGGERLLWKAHGLKPGWHQVGAGAGKIVLRAASPTDLGKSDRALLLLHGTFSNAASAYLGLAAGPFFPDARAIYGERIFAFNHYTISDSPEDNVRDLLEALPPGGRTFDVITHSRGGLVLRHMIERQELFDGKASRFRLGHAVLVASPNAGTPLATPKRYDETFGFLANLLELFGDTPWTMLPELLANGIVWLASNVVPALKGIASMDANGQVIGALQDTPSPPAGAYSVLASNYEPPAGVLARLLDAGIDRFFATANDLVVPTEGGWLVDGSTASVPAERIGCFGPGGNLTASSGAAVTHVSFFAESETHAFLVRALSGQSQRLTAIDSDRQLPTRRARRGGMRDSAATVLLPPGPRAYAAPAGDARLPPPVPPVAAIEVADRFSGDDVLQLMILGSARPDGPDESRDIQILAMYGSARAIEPFPTRNESTGTPAIIRGSKAKVAPAGGAGSRFQRIIATHRQIYLRLAGEVEKSGKVPDLPDDAKLRLFGEDMFRSLFVGKVQRLYDVARSEQRTRPLNVIFTCTIPWLASLPWEFTFDPTRRKFLVTEELQFVRNVLTMVPAQARDPSDDPLRILVVVAQPLDTQALAVDEEESRIRAGFRRLIDAHLATIDVLSDVTPDRLHRTLEAAARQGQPFDVVHFIGHGEFDRKAHAGILILTDATGVAQEVSIRALREILSGRGIQLVFLNACDTARDDQSSLNRGSAQALVEAGLPAVVANQYKVLDPSAVAFADHFYWSLATGATLGEAAREARIALNYAIEGESIDWAVPVLYARDPCYQLCRPRVAPSEVARPRGEAPEFEMLLAMAAPPGAGVSRATRAASSTRPKVIKVGVADFNHAFAKLGTLLATLNGAQSRVEFRRVEVVIPLGVWRQSTQKDGADAERGTSSPSYLDADAFGERLKSKPAELGVDYLIGFTDQWMMCEEEGEPLYNIYAWWRKTKEQRLILFSTAGFALQRSGRTTEQVITNALVGGLAAKLLETATKRPVVHKAGPKTCPFFFNPERDFGLIAGRQEFDATCRAKLEKRLPKELAPADMVAAFDRMLATSRVQSIEA